MKIFFILLSTILLIYPTGCETDKKIKKEKIMGKDIRLPAVAGTFYPGETSKLQIMLKELFSQAEKKDIKGRIIGIISPHAGYPYSGGTAAKGYKQLEGKHFDTIILVGPSHHALFKASSVYKTGGWRTPLGIVPIDEDIVNKLIDEDKTIDYYPQAHTNEHSLEVQVPFLQTILDNFKIVPIVIGDQSPALCEILANAIVKVCRDKNILLVASTDLYHGYSYDECYSSDSLVLKTVGKFDIDGFKELYTSRENVGCGAGPVYTILLAAKALGGNDCILIEHTTSGDVTGNKNDYIVGYSSFIITKEDAKENKSAKKEKKDEEILTKEEKVFLLDIARKSVELAVNGKPIPEFKPVTERLKEPKGVFVTLTKDGRLRGCIGYIQAIKPLFQSVSEMAISAALKDPRFPPVSPDEVSQLSIEISALTPLEKIDNPEVITVGRDGILIKKGFYSGLLLPQVATEYGWDRMTFLEETCHKAGLPSNAYKDPETEVFIFQALIFNEEEK